MIATLDSFRDTLEDLGNGLGVTDPVSGPVVLTLKWSSRATRNLAVQRGADLMLANSLCCDPG